MRKIPIPRFALTLTLLFFVTLSFSQEEKQVTKLLKSYVNALNKLDNTKEVNTVLSLFDKSYISNIAYVGLSGVVNKSTINYDQFSKHLSENLKNQNYNYSMAIEKIFFESEKQKAGTVSALINFQSKIEGKLAEKGTILITLVASKLGNQWKITHNNTVRVAEAREIGKCYSNLFSKGESFFNAETYYPAGVEYTREYKSYRVSTKDGKRTITNRANEDEIFVWTASGDILDNDIKIGYAETVDKAIQIVLAYIYRESCVEINFG